MPTTYWARTDSNSANNPALNLEGDPSVEITFVPFGANGDIFLESNGGSFDPDTQVLIGGTAYSFTFELSATLPTLKKDGAQQVPDQFEGSTVIVITVQNYPTAGETTRLAFLPDETATLAQMNAFGNGAISLQNIDTTGPGVICFAAGTPILTPGGERPVETLKAGDLVVTADHGPQPVIWASSSERFWPGCSANDLPVLIKAGALGAGCPAEDLVVSPQHKVLLSQSEKTQAGAPGILAPVKGLISLPGIRVMSGRRRVSYHHILFARHEIVFSAGIASESFYPGPTALGMLAASQRREISEVMSALGINGIAAFGSAARRTLTVREARELADRALSDATRLIAQLAPGTRRVDA